MRHGHVNAIERKMHCHIGTSALPDCSNDMEHVNPHVNVEAAVGTSCGAISRSQAWRFAPMACRREENHRLSPTCPLLRLTSVLPATFVSPRIPCLPATLAAQAGDLRGAVPQLRRPCHGLWLKHLRFWAPWAMRLSEAAQEWIPEPVQGDQALMDRQGAGGYPLLSP